MEIRKQDRCLRREYIRFVSQNIFGMLGVSCYVLADTFFISKVAGVNGITALNLSLPVYSLIFALGSMIGVGSATRFAILKEQKNMESELYFSNAVLWALVMGVPFMAAGAFIPGKVVALMGGDVEIVAVAIPYFRIFLLFTPFFMLNYIFNAFVRNDYDPSLAMVATVAGSLFNIVFDYILMFPVGMGLSGAALATAVSPIVSTGICCLHFRKKANGLQFVWNIPHTGRLWKGCQLGTAAFIGEFSSGVATTVFNFLILDLTGNVGVAAYGVIANLAIVATAIFNGVAQGSQPLISSCYGSGDRAGMKKLLRYGAATALSLTVLIYAVVFVGTEQLIAVFNSEQSVQMAELAFVGMRIYFTGFFFAGINIVAIGYYSASNQPLIAGISSVSRGVAAIIGCAIILAGLFGMNGVWMAFPAAEVVTLLVIIAAVFLLGKKRG